MDEILVQVVSAFVGSVVGTMAFHLAIVGKLNELIVYVDELRTELGHEKEPPKPLPVPIRRS